MSNAKHTPGPWEIGDYDEELQAVRIRAGGFVPLTPAVALAAGLDKPRAYSNARLIAAAPELLEALIQVRAAMPDRTFATAEAKLVIDMVNAAIAKAEGK
jgi:hypothetical protein